MLVGGPEPHPTRVHDNRCLLAVSASSLVHRRRSSNAGPYFGKVKGDRDATAAQMKIPVVGGEGGAGAMAGEMENFNLPDQGGAFLHRKTVPTKKDSELAPERRQPNTKYTSISHLVAATRPLFGKQAWYQVHT